VNRLSVLPNVLSVLRIILTPLFLVALFQGEWSLVLALIIFTIAALTDTFDGYYARRYDAYTFWGAFLDPIADKILIGATITAFAVLNLVSWWVVLIILIRDVLVTLLRLQKIAHGGMLKTSMLAKVKTTAQFVSIYFFFICLIAQWLQAPGAWYDVTLILAQTCLYLVAALTLYSGLDYVRK
jgi:CDP-diacylglycerol--glycerol-3-phosphate 3-phosphatidyltransferase